MTEESEKDIGGLDQLIDVLEEFRKIDPNMPVQYALSFLYVARHEGHSMRELKDFAGLSQAAVSRNVSALSNVHKRKGGGYELVATKEDIENRRLKRLYLTSKGRRWVRSIVKALRDRQ